LAGVEIKFREADLNMRGKVREKDWRDEEQYIYEDVAWIG
jgi:hypothetical protein